MPQQHPNTMTKNTHESVLIGRATEEAVAQQGEQLDHAERLADAKDALLSSKSVEDRHRSNTVPCQDLEVALSVFTFRLQCLPCSLEKVHEVPLFGVLLGKMAVIVPVIQAPGGPQHIGAKESQLLGTHLCMYMRCAVVIGNVRNL